MNLRILLLLFVQLPQGLYGLPERVIEKMTRTIKIEEMSEKTRDVEDNLTLRRNAVSKSNEVLSPFAWVQENPQLVDDDGVRTDRQTDDRSNLSDLGQRRSFSHRDDCHCKYDSG